MTIPGLILREIRHRRLNFFLGFAAISVTVSLFVVFFSSAQASNRETVRLMRDIGFNVRIIPADTDISHFWQEGYSIKTMPENHVYRLAENSGISYNHLTAILQQRYFWRDLNVIVTGMSAEIYPPGKTTRNMSYSINRGFAIIGFEPARRLSLQAGDTITINGIFLKIDRCLSECGSNDDIRIFTHLSDAQQILNQPGLINEIKALQCLCRGEYSHLDSLTQLRNQLLEILPDTRVILMQAIADARQKQRILVERYFAFILPIVVLSAMLWIGLLAFLNVRERRREIGMLRAMGFGSSGILLMFFGRAAVGGLAGALLGYLLGTLLSIAVGPRIFELTASQIRPSAALLLWSLLSAPIVAAVAVFIPSMLAVSQAPVAVLQVD